MAKFHVDSITDWESFEYKGVLYTLSHLNAHEVTFLSEKGNPFCFIVTYGLHCFAKDGSPFNIPVFFTDGREKRQICMDRYEKSKKIRSLLESLSDNKRYLINQTQDRYFTLCLLDEEEEKKTFYKICLAIYKENRKLRIHVTSAYVVDKGFSDTSKGLSIFRIAQSVTKSPKNNAGPKEARNRRRR